MVRARQSPPSLGRPGYLPPLPAALCWWLRRRVADLPSKGAAAGRRQPASWPGLLLLIAGQAFCGPTIVSVCDPPGAATAVQGRAAADT